MRVEVAEDQRRCVAGGLGESAGGASGAELRLGQTRGEFAALALGALGVVYGDIGTSPLYADMGHFGPRPIRLAWYGVAFPALLLNYFGQGALLLAAGANVTNPFSQLAPSRALYPLVTLSTMATIIAS